MGALSAMEDSMIWNHGFQHNAKRHPPLGEELHESDEAMLKDHTHAEIAVTFSYT
jgi:hypothetical protein